MWGNTVTKPQLIWHLESERSVLPIRGEPDAAGVDLSITHDAIIPPGARHRLDFGLRVAIPRGYYGLAVLRSSMRARGLTDLGAGIIDSGYRGPLSGIVCNLSTFNVHLEAGHRVFQMILMAHADYEQGLAETIEDLGPSIRGEGGFGSTGK